ncbi:transposase [Enterococcus sp. DIV0213h]
MPRRSFDTTVKIAAVELVKEAGFSVKEVILQLEVHANSFR